MLRRYLKSKDGKTVVQVSNPKSIPIISPWFTEHGYIEIGHEEFKEIRSKLKKAQRVTHGFTNDEGELQENLSHLQSIRDARPAPIQHPDTVG